MEQFDRRKWLKTAGIASAMTLFGGVSLEGKNPIKEIKRKSLVPGTMVRLSSNENPYGPSEKARQAIIDSFGDMCRYPRMFYDELLTKIAAKEGVSKDHILLTSGSTEGLKVAGLTYGAGNGEIIAADPTFQSLMTYAEQFGAYIHRVPLDENFMHDLDEMARRVTSNTRLVFLCNPNNPTGTLLPADDLRRFIEDVSDKAVVFSDEAYCDYIEQPGYPSMVEFVKEGANVIASRTFSKVYGLAGIRVGYLIARPDIIKRLSANVVSYINVAALAAANAAIDDQEFYQFSLSKNKSCKEMIYTTLDEMGLPYLPSHGNFVFFKTGQPISTFGKAMAKEGIEVGRAFPPLNDWCRISTGLEEEVEAFTAALKRVMG